jgi:hypothetical protein
MDLSYACEKFYLAVRSLVSEDTLQDRLDAAFGTLKDLEPDVFPDERLRERFSDLMRNLEFLMVGGTLGKPLSIEEIDALSKLRDEAGNLAEEILSIFTDLAYRDPHYYYHVSSGH